MRVCLYPALGRGRSYGSPDGSVMDYEFNQTVAEKIEKILSKRGFSILITNSDDGLGHAVDADKRYADASRFGADIFISLESSSRKEGWNDDRGFEVIHYPNSKESSEFASLILKRGYEKLKPLGITLKGRGKRSSDLRILRNATMPAVVIRLANCNNREDALIMSDDKFTSECAKAVARSIVSFSKKIAPPVATVARAVAPEVSILGKPVLTAEQLDQFVRKVNPNAPSVAKFFIQHGNRMGIRGDIAFCQSIHETNWFRYGGSVKANQNNYAGIGAVDSRTGGATFATPEIGALAQLQHLWAYATTKELLETIHDPRYKYVKRGVAPTWIALGGKWAVPGYPKTYKSFDSAYKAGQTYGQLILKLYEDASKIPVPPPPKPPSKPSKVRTVAVTDTVSEIDGKDYDSVLIEGKGYVRVTDAAALLGKKAVFDKQDQKIIFIER